MTATVHTLPAACANYDEHAVGAVHAFSTGRAFQHKEHRNGSVLPQLWWVLTSQSWVGLPISVFLIEHKDGLVLFDTGLDPAIVSNPEYISQAIGRFLLKRIFRFEINPEDKLGQKLSTAGFDPRRVRKAIISHLHFDHIGGISDIPQAELVVSQQEWDQLSKPHPERDWILREHIQRPEANWCPISFEFSGDALLSSFSGIHDVMGDGSLILLPTPGHTTGSISMLVRSSLGPPLLLVGDLAYSADAIVQDRVPGTGDAKQLRSTYAKVRQLKADLPDLLIIPSHDDAAISQLHSCQKKEATHVDA
ncbi:MAG: N-acyl homoserine lactonase family protein [Henriciella sp.]